MKSIKKHSVKSCAINKISQLGLFKIYSKIQFVLKTTQLVWGGIYMIPPRKRLVHLTFLYKIQNLLKKFKTNSGWN